MAANPERRRAILDAAVECLGAEGARSLSFRSVDRRAGVPVGTTTNYFKSRAVLLEAVARRIFERLAPVQSRLTAIRAGASGAAVQVAYVQYVVERLLASPELALALVELRLEAARDRELLAALQPLLQEGLSADREFHVAAGLPGNPDAVELLHYAIGGLVLDRLTSPLVPAREPSDIAEMLARRLFR